MLYFIFGTNLKKRDLAKLEIRNSLESQGVIYKSLLEVPRVETSNYELLKSYWGNISLFGEKLLIPVYNLLTQVSAREFLYQHLEKLITSENVFILDEPFAPANSLQKLKRDFLKYRISEQLFDASEKYEKEDIEPFYFCDLFERRDKKGAWQEWKRLYAKWEDSEAMALHGALWWKWKTLWSNSLNGKTALSKYSKDELEKYGREIVYLAARANNGELNLMRALEKLILSI